MTRGILTLGGIAVGEPAAVIAAKPIPNPWYAWNPNHAHESPIMRMNPASCV
jgi:hypothetical protein